ncbi:alpha/beta fold hydrolase [Georgenia sp. 10Sc9-8]|uniref:Alpha/beta fold hydrolase n=1 Tax=Georgenia halotolerans TaxID=3028317 RepID=A0ABT5U0X6_9MICO|nr:alpha/beta fold hydrolase [Georgenia halotolerans]
MARGLTARPGTVLPPAVRARSSAGPPGRDFVLVHGLGASSRYFAPLAARLRRLGTVHVLDLPGFGGAPPPAHRMSVGDLAEAVHRWVTERGLVDPVLVGHSMGAQVVVELLVRYPATSSSAVLIGPTVDPAERTAVRQVLRLAQAVLHETWTVLLTVGSDYLRCGPRWFARTLRSMLDHPMAERLPAVAAEVLVLRGERDAVASTRWIEQAARALPAGRAVVVPSGAHAVMHDHAAQVADLVGRHTGIAPGCVPGGDRRG